MSLDFSRLLGTSNAATEGITLDCKAIRLMQNKESRPRTWEAQGALNIDFRTGIKSRLVIYHDKASALDRMTELMELSRVKLGELIPASHYFAMVAVDAKGDEWTNPSVEVDATHYEGCTVLAISCDWIRCEEVATGEHDSARMLFIDELDFPMNLSKSTSISIGDRNFTSSEKAGSSGQVRLGAILVSRAPALGQFSELTATCAPGNALPSNYVAKLLEAAHFVTASRVAPCVSEMVSGERRVTELSGAAPIEAGIIRPPLMSKSPRVHDFYKLFDAYLDDTMAASSDDGFSPISAVLYPLFGTGGLPLDTIALLASVALESLVQSCFRKLAAPAPQIIEEVNQILAMIEGLKIDSVTKTRAAGSLNGMKSSRAIDKLHDLANDGLVNSDEIAAWKTLRNSSAHGSLHVSPEKQQDVLWKVYAVNVLVNRVVMTAIGYEGVFNDYSTRGWPLREHPNTEMPISADTQ